MTIGVRGALKTKGLAGFTAKLKTFCESELDLNLPFEELWRRGTDWMHGNREIVTPATDALWPTWRDTRDVKWLYTHPYYFFDPVASSFMQNAHLAPATVNLIKQNNYTPPRRVLCWGDGPGFAAMCMAANWPEAEVFSSDLPGVQDKVFEHFNLYENCHRISTGVAEGPFDLVCMFECVEHFPSKEHGVGDPVTEIENIIESSDALLSHATMWSAERSWPTLGHFLYYDIDGERHPAHKCRVPYRQAIIRRGWKLVGTGWNGRPDLYVTTHS